MGEGSKERVKEGKEEESGCFTASRNCFFTSDFISPLLLLHTPTHLVHLQWTERETVSPYNVWMIVCTLN